MILSGQRTWNSIKHKSRSGHTSPHLGQTTSLEPFLPPMTPPQAQMAYPMLHGDFTLVFLQMLWRTLDDICRSAVPPPCSVQAWIPKAKMGPTADNFRPLGMPSTFERVIDGSVATVMTKAIAPLLHPSQIVLNLFREPQSAVQSVQSTLDHDTPCACLSLDLSKAFERINPYWILQILSACKAPLWVIMYTRHILLFRRCRHKVQGKLLPSKMIVPSCFSASQWTLSSPISIGSLACLP